MKYRIFILPLLLGSVSASAYELDVYYDLNGNYDTFCTFPHVGPGDCPSPITGQEIAEKFMDIANNRDEVFSGFTLPDGTVLMDSTGDLKLTGRQVNTKGLDSTVTLHTNNKCAGTSERNPHNACVNTDYTYVDDDGFVIEPDDVEFEKGGATGCIPIRDFQVRFHPVPTKTSNYCPSAPYGYLGGHWCGLNIPNGTTLGQFMDTIDQGTYAVGSGTQYPFDPRPSSNYTGNARALECNAEDGCVTLYHCGDTSKHTTTGWYSGPDCTGQKITELNDKQLPEIAGYTLRGYYGHTFNYADYQHLNNQMPVLQMIPDLVAEHSTTYGATYAKRFVKSANERTMPLGNANIRLVKCPAEFIDNKIPTNTLAGVVVDVFGAWARDCADDSELHRTCSLSVQTTTSGAYDAGDVIYTNICESGYVFVDGDSGNKYNSQCESAGYNTIKYQFNKYKVWDGTKFTVITCSNEPEDSTCTISNTVYLPNPTNLNCDNSNYKFTKWQTGGDGIYHDFGSTVECTTNVFGGENASVTGILCDCTATFGPTSQNLGCDTICSEMNGDGVDGSSDTE